MKLSWIAAIASVVAANEIWANKDRMDTWLSNILNGFEAFERETVMMSAASDDGKTIEIESFGYEDNVIITKIINKRNWYFGDITFSNSIHVPNTGTPGADLTKLGQTSVVLDETDGLYYGYAAFTVPKRSAESDTYALTLKVYLRQDEEWEAAITEAGGFVDCSDYFTRKYGKWLSDDQIRLYAIDHVVDEDDICRFDWEAFYSREKAVELSDFESYHLGDGVFDWEAYDARPIPDKVYTDFLSE